MTTHGKAAYREQTLVVCLVQKGIDPLLVERVGPAVTRQGVHVAGCPFETAEGLIRIVQKHELVIDMIASEQQPYRCGEREPTVRPVGGKPLVTGVRFNALRQIVQIAQRMQAEGVWSPPRISPGSRRISSSTARGLRLRAR